MGNRPPRLFTLPIAAKVSGLLLLLALLFWFALDRPIMEYLLANRFDRAHPIIPLGREMGKAEYLLGFALFFWLIPFASFFASHRNFAHAWKSASDAGRKALLIIIAIVFSGVFVHILKFSIGRPRPLYAFENQLFAPQFFETQSALHSFPSGHTAAEIAFLLSLSVIFPRLFWLFTIIGAFWVSCNALVLAHWPSDILASLAIALLSFAFIRQKFPKLC